MAVSSELIWDSLDLESSEEDISSSSGAIITLSLKRHIFIEDKDTVDALTGMSDETNKMIGTLKKYLGED